MMPKHPKLRSLSLGARVVAGGVPKLADTNGRSRRMLDPSELVCGNLTSTLSHCFLAQGVEWSCR
jgi:hypothetical protein